MVGDVFSLLLLVLCSFFGFVGNVLEWVRNVCCRLLCMYLWLKFWCLFIFCMILFIFFFKFCFGVVLEELCLLLLFKIFLLVVSGGGEGCWISLLCLSWGLFFFCMIFFILIFKCCFGVVLEELCVLLCIVFLKYFC